MDAQSDDVKFYFPTVIQETMVDNHQALNQGLIGAIERLRETTPGTVPSAWSCELYTTLTTNSRLHKSSEFSALIPAIYEHAGRFARFLKSDLEHYRLEIVNCWVNIYGPHHSQDIHNHSNCLLSGVYYVRVPKGASGLLIHSPMSDSMIQAPLTMPTFANSLIHEVPAIEGKMVFFRSFVKHSVRPNRVDGERISIAFNLTA